MIKWIWKIDIGDFEKTSLYIETRAREKHVRIQLSTQDKENWILHWKQFLQSNAKIHLRMHENLICFLAGSESSLSYWKLLWAEIELNLGHRYPIWIFDPMENTLKKSIEWKRSAINAKWYDLNDAECLNTELDYQKWLVFVQEIQNHKDENGIQIQGVRNKPGEVRKWITTKEAKRRNLLQWLFLLCTILTSAWISYQAYRGSVAVHVNDEWEQGVNPLFDFLLTIHSKNQKIKELNIHEKQLPVGFQANQEKEALLQDYERQLVKARSHLIAFLRTEMDTCMNQSKDPICLASIWAEQTLLKAFSEGKADSSFLEAWLSLGCDEFQVEIEEAYLEIRNNHWSTLWKKEKYQDQYAPEVISKKYLDRSKRIENISILPGLQIRLPANSMPQALDDWERFLNFHILSPGIHYTSLQKLQAGIWTDTLRSNIARLGSWNEDWNRILQKYVDSINGLWDTDSDTIPSVDILLQPLSMSLWTQLKDSLIAENWSKKWPISCDSKIDAVDLKVLNKRIGRQGYYQHELERLNKLLPDSIHYSNVKQLLSEIQNAWWTSDGKIRAMDYSWELCSNRYAITTLQLDDKKWELLPDRDSCVQGVIRFPETQYIRIQLERNSKIQSWEENGPEGVFQFASQWGSAVGSQSIDVMLPARFGQIQTWIHWKLKDFKSNCIQSTGE